ncbi:MAG: hypothetical protein WCK78_03325 [Paludibacter sp.]
MKTSKYIVIIILFLTKTSIALQAQDTILNRNISVEREYRPVIQDAGKINLIPRILEPKTEKSPAQYSDFNLPLNADYNIHTFPAAELTADKISDKGGFARIGFGTYLNTLVDASYLLINKPDMLLNITLNHGGTLEANRFHTSTKTDVSFQKQFKKLDFYAGLGGSHEYLRYYGDTYNRNGISDFNTLKVYGNPGYTEVNRTDINTNSQPVLLYDLLNQSADDTFWRFNTVVGLHSLTLSKEMEYAAEVGYNLFSSINGLTEHQIHTKAGFSLPSDNNRLGLDMDIYNFFYNSVKIQSFNYLNTYSVLNLNPYYTFLHEQWNVRVGAKTAFVVGKENVFYPTADVRAEWKLLPKLLTLYGGLTGGYQLNSQDKVLAENPYLYSDLRVNDTYSPYNLYVGFKVKPIYNLLVDAYVDFQKFNNQYFFVNKEYKPLSSSLPISAADSSLFSNRFNVIYKSATLLKVGLRATYSLQDILNVELKGAYNGWNVADEQHAWNKPTYEATLNVSYKIDNSFTVIMNTYYEGGRFARLMKLNNLTNIYEYVAVPMGDKVDINLGLNYCYDKQFSAFAKINNIFNSLYQNFYGYDLQGINFMLGGSVTF